MEKTETRQKSILNGILLELGKTLEQSIWGAEEAKIRETKLFANSGWVYRTAFANAEVKAEVHLAIKRQLGPVLMRLIHTLVPLQICYSSQERPMGLGWIKDLQWWSSLNFSRQFIPTLQFIIPIFLVDNINLACHSVICYFPVPSTWVFSQRNQAGPSSSLGHMISRKDSTFI